MQKTFWTLQQAFAVFLIFGAVPLGYLFDHILAGWLAFLFVILLHLSELLVTIPLARQRKLSIRVAILKTMLFGYTWWVPLKRGLLQG
jgi:hypothetical protein